MRNVWTIAGATYGFVTRSPLYYITLGAFALLIYCSSFLTQFSFSMETQMVREMGLASLVLWGFVVTVVLCGVIVTQELEDRTAVTLLCKPIRRSAFLVGKFAGLMLALVPGLFILGGVLFYTLWLMSQSDLFGHPGIASAAGWTLLIALVSGAVLLEKGRRRIRREEAATSGRASRRLVHAGAACMVVAGVAALLALEFSKGGLGDGDAGWEALMRNNESVWNYSAAFMKESGIVILEGFVLCLLQVGVLAAVCVSLSAFFPAVVSVAATAAVFILGNISTHMQASLERVGFAPLTAAGRALTFVLPNFGLLNLQTHFSEGTIISPGYLALAALHAILYSAIVFTVSCAFFERREIR